jgi:hypothetical protein
VRDFGRDTIINKIMADFGMTQSIIVYNFLTANPLEIALHILFAKFGMSKILITCIFLFIL